jgi:predicted  nucleic acid-binding Zn-ribbon protein
VRTNIETLYAARDNLDKAKEERKSKYDKERADLIQAVANELKTTADPARVLQRQTELQNKEKQRNDEEGAIDSMIKTVDEQLEALSQSNPAEMIEVLTKRIDELQKRCDEADSKSKVLSKELTKLRKLKDTLESRIKGKASQTTQPSPATQPSQPSPATQRAQTKGPTGTTRKARRRRGRRR